MLTEVRSARFHCLKSYSFVKSACLFTGNVWCSSGHAQAAGASRGHDLKLHVALRLANVYIDFSLAKTYLLPFDARRHAVSPMSMDKSVSPCSLRSSGKSLS